MIALILMTIYSLKNAESSSFKNICKRDMVNTFGVMMMFEMFFELMTLAIIMDGIK